MVDVKIYTSVHQWLKRKHNRAYKCENENCLKESNKYHWSLLKGKEYEKKIENFWQLCNICNYRYDNLLNKIDENMVTFNPQDILKHICQKYGITLSELRNRNRSSHYVRARREATFILREELKLSFPHIGRLLKQDHSTCIYNFRKFTKTNESKSETSLAL